MTAPLGRYAGKRPVSPRQLQVLQIIERSLVARGFPPTLAELLDELGLAPSSRQTVHEHIERCVAKGMINRIPRLARGLQLTAAARELLARVRAQRTENVNVSG